MLGASTTSSRRPITNDSVAPHLELALVNHDKAKTVSRNQFSLALVVECPLLPARNAGYCRSPIEDRGRVGVLLFLELHHQLVRPPVSIDW